LPLEQLTDLELLTLLSSDKKQKAFGILYARYHAFVLKKCNRIINNKSEAEEVAHTVFLKVDSHYQRFEQKSSFKTWLYAIAYRESLYYLREQKKNPIETIDIKELEEKYGHIDLDEEINLDQANNLALLDKIEPLEKALLLMRYKDDMKIKTIAEALQMGESAIKMRLKRAKANLLKWANK
jgi:RNA polymerase sigma factor (sigma-70 family)